MDAEEKKQEDLGLPPLEEGLPVEPQPVEEVKEKKKKKEEAPVVTEEMIDVPDVAEPENPNKCEKCDGQGLLGDPYVPGNSVCPNCQGKGVTA